MSESATHLATVPTEVRIDRRSILALGIGVCVLLSCVVAVQFPLENSWIRFLDNVHWTSSYAVGTILAYFGYRASPPRFRTARWWFTLGLAGMAVGQLLWDLQVAIDMNPFPGPSDLFFLCLGPCFAFGLLSALRSRTAPEQMRAAMLDTVALSVAVVAFSLVLYLPKRGDSGAFPLVVMVAYPVGLLAAACIGTIVAITARFGANRRWTLLLLPLIGSGILWMRWNSLTLEHALGDGTPLNFLFSVDILLLGLGSMVWEIDDSRDPSQQWYAEGLLVLLPLLLVAVALVTVAVTWMLPGLPAVVECAAFIGSGVVIMLAAIRQSLLLTDRTRLLTAERAVREAHERYQKLFEMSPDAIFIFDGSTFVDCNPAAPRAFGCSREELLGRRPGGLSPRYQPDGTLSEVRARQVIEAAFTGKVQPFKWTYQRNDGSLFEAEVSLNRFVANGQAMIHGMVRDITAMSRLERQLLQAQRMESLGTLAGGIAHDFNNILAIISSHAEMMLLVLGDPERLRKKVATIQSAAQRGAGVVRQLLTFARKSEIKTKPLRMNDQVEELVQLLQGTFPKSITIATDLDPTLPQVLADPTQIHQILMNLCVNARDSMPNGGELRIATALVAAAELGKEPVPPAAQYVSVSVQDSGAGMDERTRDRIFEPFFSTKEVGKGTGLGLAVVFGIVRDLNGAVDVQTSPGAGSKFVIFLPVYTALNEAPEHRTFNSTHSS